LSPSPKIVPAEIGHFWHTKRDEQGGKYAEEEVQ
jgi:hypothetical protein